MKKSQLIVDGNLWEKDYRVCSNLVLASFFYLFLEGGQLKIIISSLIKRELYKGMSWCYIRSCCQRSKRQVLGDVD